MGLGLVGAYGEAGGQDELEKLVADRIKQTLLKQAAEQQQAELALKTRGLDIDERQGDARIGLEGQRVGFEGQRVGLEQDKFGHEKQQWSDLAPQRDANVAHTGAQTGEILRQPAKEAADRAHDGTMLDKRGTWNLREIGASGAEQRKTQSHGASLKPTPAGGPGSGQSPYAQERNVRNLNSIRQLMDKANGWTTGVGSTMANIPATDARDFAAQLNTLKANIAFGELAAMREASKTGGALGAVSERELALLESALGALDPGQSTDSFKGQLQQIADSITRWENVAGVTNAPSGSMGRAGGAGPAQGGAAKPRFTIQSVK
jgi:hypothetical protein